MTPAQREDCRQRELDRIFQLGWDAAADAPPLTDEQIERIAFIINPRLAAPSDHAPALPQAA
jgi:hypothetical protein